MTITEIDRTHRRFLIEAGVLLQMYLHGGYALYVTDLVKPDAPVPGVPDPALFFYYALAPKDEHSHPIASVETLWPYVHAPSGQPLDLPTLLTLPLTLELVCAFPYVAMDPATREFIWPGWPAWPDATEGASDGALMAQPSDGPDEDDEVTV